MRRVAVPSRMSRMTPSHEKQNDENRSTETRVLGIDPGLNITGYGVISVREFRGYGRRSRRDSKQSIRRLGSTTRQYP